MIVIDFFFAKGCSGVGDGWGVRGGTEGSILLGRRREGVLRLLYGARRIATDRLTNRLKVNIGAMEIEVGRLGPRLRGGKVRVLSGSECKCCLSPERPRNVRKLLGPERGRSPIVPSGGRREIRFLLTCLLGEARCVGSRRLYSFLCVSGKALAGALQRIRRACRGCNVAIRGGPKCNVHIRNDRFGLHRYVMSIFMGRSDLRKVKEHRRASRVRALKGVICRYLGGCRVRLSRVACGSFIRRVCITVQEVHRRGCIRPRTTSVLKEGRGRFIRRLARLIKTRCRVHFSRSRGGCLALRLIKGICVSDRARRRGFIVRDRVSHLVARVLRVVCERFRISFEGSFRLHVRLGQRVIPFILHVGCRVVLHGPVLRRVHGGCILSCAVTSRTTVTLKGCFRRSVSRSRVTKLTRILRLTLRRRRGRRGGFSVLVMYTSKGADSRVLECGCDERFGRCVRGVCMYGLCRLRGFPFRGISCMFAAMRVSSCMPMPVLRVNSFLRSGSVSEIEGLFTERDGSFLRGCFGGGLFFASIRKGAGSRILGGLYQGIRRRGKLPRAFATSILGERRLAPASCNGLITLPRPRHTFRRHTFITITILGRPVF